MGICICIYTPVPVVYVHGDGIYHQQETVHSPAAVAPLQPGRPSSPSRRPRGDQDHPPGRALIDPECFSRPCHPSTANWSTPLPTGEPPRQPSARTHGPPPTGESPATVAHARPRSPPLSSPLPSPISSGRRRARPQSPIFLRQLASPRALSIPPRFPRTPSPSPGRRPRSRPTVREAPRTALRGQRPPRPRPLPHPRRRPLALSPSRPRPASQRPGRNGPVQWLLASADLRRATRPHTHTPAGSSPLS